MKSIDIKENKSFIQSRYRPEIDGLRAFAVIAVFINHFNKEILPNGYLGVDIFFVISGFVITSSLYQRQSKNLREFIKGFYERRIRRLVPAISLFVLIMSIAICLFNPNPGSSLKVGLTSLFGLSNIFLYQEYYDYFKQSTQLNVFTHTWSLAVEEQFYILFPFLVWFSGFGRQTKNGARNLFLSVGSLAIASLISFLYLYPINQRAAYFLMPMRFWEIASGCLLFIVIQKKKSIKQYLEKVPPILVLALMILIMYLPMSWAAASTVAIVTLSGLLIGSMKKQTLAYRIFTHPKIVYIGLISYSLYLWHWGILSISRWTIGIHWWSLPFQVILTFSLAIASYKYLERPLRKNIWLDEQGRTIKIGGGVIVILAAGLFALGRPLKGQLYLGKNLSGTKQLGVNSLITPYKIEGYQGSWAGKDCVISSNNEVGKKIKLEKCTLGNTEIAKTRVLVIGDSFSAAFVHAFDDLVKSNKYAITITSSWGASPVPELPSKTAWSKANDYYWSDVIPSFIDGLDRGDIVFVVDDYYEFFHSNLSETQKMIALRKGIRNLYENLSKKGIRLVFLHSLPFAREAQCDPEKLFPQWFQIVDKEDTCKTQNKDQSIFRRKNLDKTFSMLKREGIVEIVDLFDIFCPQTECSYFGVNKILLYRDRYSHATVEAARLSAPLIKSIFEKLEETQSTNNN